METFPKQPSEELDYPINGKDFLETTDTISSVISTTITDKAGNESPVTLEVFDTVYTTTKVILWLRGGTNGVTYKVESLIQTVEGRKVEHEFFMKVKDI